MPLNVNIPAFYCQLRREYLYDLQSHIGEFEPVWVIGASSIPGRAIGFHIITERGAQIDRLPITALAHRVGAHQLPLDHLELWDCFSYYMDVIEYENIRNLRVRALLKDGSMHWGIYQFTFDWYGAPMAEDPGEGGHKSAHFLALDNGCYAALPNNRIYWHEPSFITDPFRKDERPDYITNSHVWRCETLGKWTTSKDYRMYYEIVETEKGSQNDLA